MTKRRADAAFSRVMAIAACLVLALSCDTKRESGAAQRESGTAEPYTRYLDAWYSCIECDEGQLDSLVSHSGGRERERSWTDLATAARIGPTASRLSAIRSLAESDYDTVQASLASLNRDPLLSSKDEYAKYELDAYVQRYRVRAAVALRRMDQTRGIAVIDSVLRSEKDSTLLELFKEIRRGNLR